MINELSFTSYQFYEDMNVNFINERSDVVIHALIVNGMPSTVKLVCSLAALSC